MALFTNKLAKETSPYLLQHAHNPVDWHPWGAEALSKAVAADKPILVSIGYAACHWCHVMEKESFEDEETARIMNDNFVNIKIDREERPDLDHIYMDAVQAMTGSGGWPLNVFLTPEKKPFYGGTYFPPQRAFNRASWKEVLHGVSEAFRNNRDEIEAQAENLTHHLLKSNDFGLNKSSERSQIFSRAATDEIFINIMKSADRINGGFGRAPKFPQTFSIQYLLHYYYYSKDKAALEQACLSLDKMIYGGIYDQLGGGFARYSTDNEWLVPHFEKMLYDNALLVGVLCDAYQITKNSLYSKTIQETLSFIEREMTSSERGFYSALDADSEGVEGKFYVWEKAEIESILQEDAPLFCEFYGVSAEGNWEHTNILHVPVAMDAFAAGKNVDPKELEMKLDRCREKLLAHRNKRIRPLLDDKILLGWNALMNLAYCKAFAALGELKYKTIAVNNMNFLLKRFASQQNVKFYHTYKNGEAKYPAFLDDYAYLIQALIFLQEITGNSAYLVHAKEITESVIRSFKEEETGFFYFTGYEQQDILIRKKELYDGAVPSGNSIMALNLYYLAVVFDKPDWRETAIQLCSFLKEVIIRYPTSFGVWATLFQALTYGIPEIALLGKNIEGVYREFLSTFIPFKIFQSATTENNEFPLLSGKTFSPEPQFFLCKDYSCQVPVSEVHNLVNQLEKV